MKTIFAISLLLVSFQALLGQLAYSEDTLSVEPGISQALATQRAQRIHQLAYQLAFEIPGDKTQPIPASAVITFNLQYPDAPLQLDFKENQDHLHRIEVNGQEVPIDHVQEHIIISAAYLRPGNNQLRIQFTAGELSLNRNDDFLYTLLVPDRARTVFPCFDQPDLKATFQLSLTLPQHWQALTNAALQDSTHEGAYKTYHFLPSDTLSTYLFSFVAGEFDRIARQVGEQPLHFYHRETDSAKINASVEPIFQIHLDALAFLEEYTQIPYPFQKFDFVALPDFQYGGMEHAGAIDYKASALFLDESATQDQKISRSSLIAHETAHMWFGDLVTMRWFNDVWMKEVFANFMADKITRIALPGSNEDLKFLIDHFPAAYAIDRTPGANPIRQPLDNLQEAGTLYGGIIYHKAPIMMRQLEQLMGEVPFRQGLQDYLQQYAFGNASWPELIALLDNRTPANLLAWNEVWVNQTGRPWFDYQLQTTPDGKIAELSIIQQGEDGSRKVWPQQLAISLVYTDRVEPLLVQSDQERTLVREATGRDKPRYIMFNTSGKGYGLFPVDSTMLTEVYEIQDTVARAAAYINLYENMLNGRYVQPDQLLTILQEGLQKEPHELNLTLLTDQLVTLFWQFTTPEKRKLQASQLEEALWQAMQQRTESNQKKVLFRAYQQVAMSRSAQQKLYEVWQQKQPPVGVRLSEDDYTSLALALALREYQSPDSLLTAQLDRIQNPDRRKRLAFLMPALSGEAAIRQRFFDTLRQASGREKEAWVVSALGYLHHPLRAGTSEKYLRASLDLLEDIQQTGDIFFPQRWLEATFGSYQSLQATQTVRQFLEQHPAYPPQLKAKILQSTDRLFRASKLLYETAP